MPAPSRRMSTVALVLAAALLPTAAAHGATASASASAPASASHDGGYLTLPGTREEMVRGDAVAPAASAAASAAPQTDAASTGPATARFDVTYTGFTPEARAAFQRAVDTWAHVISSPVPITIDARFDPLPDPVLGSAGPSDRESGFPGAPRKDTFYTEALANKLAGHQLAPGADIEASFSRDYAGWYFGTGTPGPEQSDFESVVLHELGHGLGFEGLANVVDGKGSMAFQGYADVFDRQTTTADGTPLLSITDPKALATALQSGGVYFDSPQVRSAGGGKPARLFAPNPWTGSSYNHMDEKTYPSGSADALMTPAIDYGETSRRPGPVTAAIFHTMGW